MAVLSLHIRRHYSGLRSCRVGSVRLERPCRIVLRAAHSQGQEMSKWEIEGRRRVEGETIEFDVGTGTSAPEDVVDLDAVVTDVQHAGYGTGVFGPDSPQVVGEEFFHMEEWRTVGFDSQVEAEKERERKPDEGGIEVDVLPMGPSIPEKMQSAYSPEQGFKEMSVADLGRAMMSAEPPVLIDVRSEAEFKESSISGAVNVPMEDLSQLVKSGGLDKYRGKKIAMICGSGVRSMQATVRLSKLFAFNQVFNVAGGMIAWTESGLNC